MVANTRKKAPALPRDPPTQLVMLYVDAMQQRRELLNDAPRLQTEHRMAHPSSRQSLWLWDKGQQAIDVLHYLDAQNSGDMHIALRNFLRYYRDIGQSR
jgi:hypothetical protein